MDTELPYIDGHAVRVDAPRKLVWTTLQRYTASLLRSVERNPLLALLNPRPRAGFEVTERIEQRLISLAGRHRFSRYRQPSPEPTAAFIVPWLSARGYTSWPPTICCTRSAPRHPFDQIAPILDR